MSKHLLAATVALVMAGPAGGAERREVGAHQHGHGVLNIAIDGNKVALELEAPGADITGFEYDAKSDKDKAAVKQAIATLEKPLALFKVPDGAQCKVSEAKVRLETEQQSHGDHEHHGHDHDKHEKAGPAAHAAFHAEYLLECSAPAGLKTLTLDYFTVFKGAEGLTIEVIAPKGQSKFEATRDKTVVDLSGLL